MSVDPIWQPGPVMPVLAAQLQLGMPAGVLVYDEELPAEAGAPYVLLAAAPSPRAAGGLSGGAPGLLLRLRAICAHRTVPEARALGDIVRVRLAAAYGTGYQHPLDLSAAGVRPARRETLEDGAVDKVGGVAQWNEGYELVLVRG